MEKLDGEDGTYAVNGVLGGVEAVAHGAAAIPTGQDTSVGGQLLHEEEGVPGGILEDGVEEGAGPLVIPGGGCGCAGGEILFQLKDELVVEGFAQLA